MGVPGVEVGGGRHGVAALLTAAAVSCRGQRRTTHRAVRAGRRAGLLLVHRPAPHLQLLPVHLLLLMATTKTCFSTLRRTAFLGKECLS